MTETTVRLNASGMHCRSCSMMVDMTVGELPGVVECKTDHASGETMVRFDSDTVSVDDIIGAIRSEGYDAQPVS